MREGQLLIGEVGCIEAKKTYKAEIANAEMQKAGFGESHWAIDDLSGL